MLARRLLDLVGIAVSDQTIVRLELLQGLEGIVDKGEASGLSTTEVSLEAKDGDGLLVGLVELGKLRAEVLLGDVGTTGVEDVTANAKKHWSANRGFCFGIAPSIPSPNPDPISNPRPKLGSDPLHQIEAISRPNFGI